MAEIEWLPYGGEAGTPVLNAGYLLKMRSGEIMLMGHINENLGGCDCCTEIPEFYSTSYYDQVTAMLEAAEPVPEGIQESQDIPDFTKPQPNEQS